MLHVPEKAALAGLLILYAAACQPNATDRVVSVGDRMGPPAYAPDDPCKGVVPELCPR